MYVQGIFLYIFSNRNFLFNEERSSSILKPLVKYTNLQFKKKVHQLVMNGNVYSEGGPVNGHD
jgi:hypothetical protein